MKKPIFILGAHKSGTSLIRSLFDSHPELFVVPIETHFFYHLNYWIRYSLRISDHNRNINGLRLEQFIKSIKGGLRYANTEENPLADAITKNQFDIDSFDEYIDKTFCDFDLNETRLDLKICFSEFMKGIYFSIYRKELPENIRILEKSTESFEFAFDLNKIFPDACFIHIIRNPYANLVALRKYKIFNRKPSLLKYYPWIGREIRGLCQAFYFLQRNKNLIKNYHVLKYETLLSTPDQTIEWLSKITDISFQETLLHPTFLGNNWGGNSSSGKSFSGISNKSSDKWKNEIQDLEIFLVNRNLKHVIEKYNYETLSPRSLIYLPSDNEYPKEYFANRLLCLTD